MKSEISKELAQKYQEQLDRVNRHEYFEDAKICDVCGSPNVHFSQRQNGVGRTCLDCRNYEISRK